MHQTLIDFMVLQIIINTKRGHQNHKAVNTLLYGGSSVTIPIVQLFYEIIISNKSRSIIIGLVRFVCNL